MRRVRDATVMGLAATSAVGFLAGCSHPAQSTATSVSVSTAPVVRTTVSQSQEVSGALGYVGSYSIIGSSAGTLTWLPAPGQVVGRGQAAYELDGVPVPLMYGARPAWRVFELGMTDGSDVLELNQNLAALGYANGLGLVVNDDFSWATYLAVWRWQTAVGLPVTGTVPLGQVAFAPGPMLVSGSSLSVGAQVQSGQTIVSGTSTQRAVLVQLDSSLLPNVHVGDPVTVTLPDGSTRTGKVTQIGSVAVPQSSGSSGNSQSSGSSGSGSSGNSSQAAAPVTISVTGSVHGWLNQAQVQVGIVSQQAKNVLAVPTVALLAGSGGTYQVIVVNGSQQQHVTVQPSLYDENTGMTAVTGNLSVGERVEVPSASS